MSIITLTTDLGLKDFYVGALKGSIYKQFPEAHIVDISHDISKFNIMEAAFVIQNAFFEFPKGSIHILGVKAEQTLDSVHVAVEYKDHIFLAADNGIFSLFLEEPPSKIFELTVRSSSPFPTFPTKDVLAKAACHLARGGTLEVIGKPMKELKELNTYKPVLEGNTIVGSVIYLDSYGNAVTNITQSLFESFGKNREFTIITKVSGYNIKTIRDNYHDVNGGERLAIFGTNGHLEIAMNIGVAGKLMGLKINDNIKIEFKN
ncbi:MAG: hypothetical protein CL840_17555 [Crocinitomicaceae bacterium]|nr:hypothetical protein [Crocinitomicaceae bacterium]|tara:strand:- start:8559 stop:9341 length:783 start_codon:yes stop_codon:yes gene_type:complete